MQEAEATFRGSVELWRALVAEFPANLEYREGYSVAARDYGTLLVDLGHHGEAEDLFRQARLIEGKQGIAPFHGPTEEQHLMARTGRPQEAETHFRQAIQTQKDKLARSPNDPDLRFSLAYTQLNLKELLWQDAGGRREAEELIREAISLLSRLVRDFPHTTQYRRNWGRPTIICS